MHFLAHTTRGVRSLVSPLALAGSLCRRLPCFAVTMFLPLRCRVRDDAPEPVLTARV